MRKRAVLAGFPVYIAALGVQLVPQAKAVTINFAHQEQEPTEQRAPQQAQNLSSTTHKAKVWTNEDLIATRTPADIYIFEKEAKAAASELAAYKAVTSCFAFDQPEGTLEETKKAIADALQSIQDSDAAVAQARMAIADAPENLKARNQAELDRRKSELENSLEQLRSLQNRLQELTGQPAGSMPDEPPTPPQ